MLIISGLTLNVFNDDRYNINCNNPPPSDNVEKDTQLFNDGSPSTSNSRATSEPIEGSSLIEQNANGGSWLDSFEDESGVDFGQSNKLLFLDGDCRVKRPIPKQFEPDQNTVGLWHLDENTGSTVSDESSKNNDGTIYGAIWMDGVFNKSLRFDGAGSQRVEISDDNSLDLSSIFTLEAWVYREGNTNRDMIICKEHAYYLQIDNFDILALNIYSGGNNIYFSKSTIPIGQWVHVAATADGNYVRIYINKCLDAEYTQTVNCNTNSNIVEIGRLYYQPLNWFFKGRIDEVRISNIARNYSNCRANITSGNIEIPDNMNWDTLIINRTRPEFTNFTVEILNSSDNQPIPGTQKYLGEGEFDISFIDSRIYPSIKLYGLFRDHGLHQLSLHYWCVSWNATNAWRDTSFGGDKCFKNKLDYGDGECWLNTDPTKWIRYYYNPILKLGPGSSWDDTMVARPSVVNNGTGYMMWYLGDSGSKWEIGLATSPDGETWTKYSGNPVLTVGSSSSWDDSFIAGPCVIYDGNIYKMWYHGRGTNFKIGYATSNDGYNWQKYHNNPVLDLGPSGSFDDNYVSDPYVYFDGLLYHMWYTAKKGSTQKYSLGYARSYDGEKWTKYVNNPIITNPSGDAGGLCIIPGYGNILGWYSLSSGSGAQINHATSKDGYTWLSYPNNPVFQKSNTGWDGSDVGHPDIILKEKQYFMYYMGRGSNYQIGLAKSRFESHGDLFSEEITIPAGFYYDKLIINNTVNPDSLLRLEIIDGTSGITLQHVSEIKTSILDLSSISVKDHPSIRLRLIFNSTGNTSVLYDWSVSWRPNITLRIDDINAPDKINRTFSAKLKINLTSNFVSENLLNLNVQYKSPSGIDWENAYLSSPIFITDHWECLFTPDAYAELGLYTFNVSCNDSHGNSEFKIAQDLILVINNKPTEPTVTFLPLNPKTMDNITVYASDAHDVEVELIDGLEIEYWYFWYKGAQYMPEFDNFTIIPYTFTQKNELWRCEVFPFDSDELGAFGFAEIVIENTPPVLKQDFDEFIMDEDTTEVLNDLLYTLFFDADNDTLEFSSIGQNKIKIEIFQANGTIELTPDENWFGIEYVTFSANDTYSKAAQETVKITVKPVNDLPEIVSVGSKNTKPNYPELTFLVDQDSWLNLTIIADDIDGDLQRGMIQYFMNITNQVRLYLNDTILHFYPTNDDVGIIYYFNISITDNNETPLQYVWQHIRIIVRNINDPPTVRILSPFHGAEFFSDENITFNCAASDIDFLIPEPTEKLTFKWLTNNTNYSSLGIDQHLRNLELAPGYYNVSVLVTDSGGKSAIDHVNITIKERPEQHVDSKSEQAWWGWLVWLIIIIIIIICILLLFYLRHRKKRREDAYPAVPEGGEVVIPDGMYLPAGGVLSAIPAADQLGAPMATPVISQASTTTQASAQIQPTPTSAPSAQLPPAQPQVQVPLATPTAQESELSPQEKLKLLEERLIRGEISEETYLNLKDRIEFEAKQTGPAPQLPPAQAVTAAAAQPELAPVPIQAQIQAPTTTPIAAPVTPTPETPVTPETPISSETPETETPEESVKPPDVNVPTEAEPIPVEPELPTDLPTDAYQQQQKTTTPQSDSQQTPTLSRTHTPIHSQTPQQPTSTHSIHSYTPSTSQHTPSLKPQTSSLTQQQENQKPETTEKKPENVDAMDELEDLDALWADGRISLEEYHRRKQELMKGSNNLEI
jgi:predicted GH43/DUF377 family glycosyl hydrolase/uncharacterized membrane protein